MKKLQFVLALFLVELFFPTSIFSQETDIQVSPHILNLQSSGIEITVHTNIYFWNVSTSTVTLNDVAIQSWKADDCGFFVAKFNSADFKNLDFEVGGYNTFTLKGYTKSGDLFYGSEDILVIDRMSEGKE